MYWGTSYGYYENHEHVRTKAIIYRCFIASRIGSM